MKLYVSCDMEGTAGVCAWEQCDARKPHPEYAIYREYMTGEVVAAIEGARESGAGETLINDSHGPMRNLLLDELPPNTRVINGNRKPFNMAQGSEGDVDGAFFTGYHGAGGAMDSVLSHTYSPNTVYEARLNGAICSEATLNAALLGHHGVPLLLITGDRTSVEGVQRQMPWVKGAIVKESIGNFSANSMSPAAAQALIRNAAREAVKDRANAQLYIARPPITLEIDLVKVEQGDLIEMIPGFERIAPRTVRFNHDDYLVVFKALISALRMGALA